MNIFRHVLGTFVSLALCALAGELHAASSGSFDTPWGGGGTGTAQIAFDLGPLKTDTAEATVLGADGSMYFAGTVQGLDGKNHIGVAKLKPNGTPDTQFSGNGENVSLLADVIATGIALSPDGERIYVSGYTTQKSPDFDMVVCLFSADGGNAINFPIGGNSRCASPDSFPGSGDKAKDIAVRPDGKIVVAGTMALTSPKDTYAAFARFEVDGSRDTSFGNLTDTNISLVRGALYEAHDIRALALAADGRVIGVGTTRLNNATDLDGLVVTLEENGIQASFAEAVFDEDGGTVRDTVVNDVVALEPTLDDDAAIVIVGSAELSDLKPSGYIGKLFVNGNFDLSGAFGGPDGATTVTLSQDDFEFTDIARQADGRYLVLGKRILAGFPFQLIDVMRFSASGQPAQDFGIDNGHTIIDFQTSHGFNVPAGIAVQGNDAIHVAGFAKNDDLEADFFAARLNLDTVFADGFEQ